VAADKRYLRAPLSPAIALAAAERLCGTRGARLTALRRAVLELLLSSATPRTAYELLEALHIRQQRTVAPQTIYRALDFLCQQRLALRLEIRKAYIACPDPGAQVTQVLFICDACGHTLAIEDEQLQARLRSDASVAGFQIVRQVVEVDGLCQTCSNTAAANHSGT
jgi:Fur family zinc uptake transcriptional regulator